MSLHCTQHVVCTFTRIESTRADIHTHTDRSLAPAYENIKLICNTCAATISLAHEKTHSGSTHSAAGRPNSEPMQRPGVFIRRCSRSGTRMCWLHRNAFLLAHANTLSLTLARVNNNSKHAEDIQTQRQSDTATHLFVRYDRYGGYCAMLAFPKSQHKSVLMMSFTAGHPAATC